MTADINQSIEEIQKNFKEQWENYNNAVHSLYSAQPMLITASMGKQLSVAIQQLMKIKDTIDGLSDLELQLKTFLKICKIRIALAPIEKIIKSCQDEHKNRINFLLMGYLKKLETDSIYDSSLNPSAALNRIFYQYLFIPFKKIAIDLKTENAEMSLPENSMTTMKFI